MKKWLMAAALSTLLATPLFAAESMFVLHDHPGNQIVPPPYGLRLDNLLGSGSYTFSFDYSDMTGSAEVLLTYDDVTGEIHIFGRAYGGKDTGSDYDPVEQGWIDIDFTYRNNLIVADDASGSPGDDFYVTAEDLLNNGTVTLDGWGGDQTFDIRDKLGDDRTFVFDNDTDHKNNSSFANNVLVWSGTGWLQGAGSGTRDWTFWAEEMMSVPVDQTTWSAAKKAYRD